ncbi:MAG: AAA domain-containing protein, partial [Coprococcus sp.]
HDHSEEFAKQPLVSSLIEGHLTWEPKQVFMSRADLDRQISPAQLVTPLSADGSQMVAIQAAAAGNSFVMHGPPGTGKSQTITNMIANALYQGKSVLFLARKMPALEVVQKRLDEIGLGPFCLELHANKASRRHVLAQFEETLKLAARDHDRLYGHTSDQIMEKRQEIRSLIERLHMPSKCGKSLYELMGILEAYHEAPDSVLFDAPSAMLVTESELADWGRQLKVLRETTELLSDIPDHPLRKIRTRQFRRNEKQQLRQQMQVWFGHYDQLQADIVRMQEMTGISACDAVDIREYVSLADVLAHAVIYPELMADLLADGYDFEHIGQAWEEIERTEALLKEVDEEYDREILTANLKQIREGWLMAGDSNSRSGRMMRTSILRTLRQYALRPDEMTADDMPERLEHLMVLQERYNQTGRKSVLAERLLRNGQKVDWPLWQKAHRRMQQVMDRLDTLIIDEESYVTLQEYIEHQAMEPDDGFREDRKYFAGIKVQYESLKQCTESIIRMSGYEYDSEKISVSDLMFEEEWRTMLRDWQDHYQDLDAWCCYMQEAGQAENMGLAPVVAAVENGLAPEDIEPAFYKGWAGTYVKRTIEKNPQLQYFSGLSYEQIIEKYRELCNDFERISREEIRVRLLERLPDKKEGSSSKDMGILQKAIMGGGSKLTIRQLFAKMPEAVRLLAPCMLMSPASVAQFIDPDFPKFDLIIMDEASQMPTCEAVGALARGTSVVIAGDEQQLPPTNFFKKKDAGEDIEMDDLESILDDALAINMPQCYLSWHYRSAHESLIAFSNIHYYDQGLRTFPSPDHQVSAVRFVNTGGVYDRSGTRTNDIEAQQVVEEMKRRVMADHTRSIGVIAFNIQQSGLIEDKWAEQLDEDSELAVAVSEMPVPVFIKNLENIQGDERDIILFSLGYGPDTEGKMSMNFGPVNQNGGHRRLNVAVTRAKQEMVVFASFEPSDIHTTDRSAQGLKDLKAFMDYAERGCEALEYREQPAAAAKEHVNALIAGELRKKGYDADINVGTSQFRIDVAVRHPQNPEKYLLGIVFDDDASALEDTVRDRAILQKDVLHRMGWRIINIWLLDWWEDSRTQIQRIEAAIHELMDEE